MNIFLYIFSFNLVKIFGLLVCTFSGACLNCYAAKDLGSITIGCCFSSNCSSVLSLDFYTTRQKENPSAAGPT